MALDAAAQPASRVGFMAGQGTVPDDLNEMGAAEIAALSGETRHR